jgi:hypothetical protein
MRIRDFAGPSARSGVTARARDERSVAPLVALLLRVDRQLGGRAGRAQPAARPPGERGVHFGGAVARRRQLGLVLLQFLGHAVDGRPSAWPSLWEPTESPRGPADAGCGAVRRSRGATWHVGRASRRRAAARLGLVTSRVAGAAWAFVLGRARGLANVPTLRVPSHAARRALRPRRGRTRPPGPFAVRGVTLARAHRRGSRAPPSARSRQSPERPARARRPAAGRTVRRRATSVRRALARR